VHTHGYWPYLQCAVPGCGELYADRQPGAEEAGLPVSDELRQEPARHGHHGCQHIRQGGQWGTGAFHGHSLQDLKIECLYINDINYLHE